MIAITVSGKKLILPPDIRLRFELLCSAFDFGNIPAGIVWEFELSAPENANTLDYAHYIDIKTKRRAYDAIGTLHGKEITGKLVTSKTGNIKYQCSFIINGFPVDALDRKLPELFTDGVSFVQNEVQETMRSHANDTVTKTYPEVNYNFPMYKNTEFYGTENTTFQGIVNRWDQSLQTFSINDASALNYNEHSLSPWLYLCYVVKQIFSALGYTASGSFFQHAEIKKLLLYNNYAIDRINQFARASWAGTATYNLPLPNDSVVLPLNDVTTVPNADPEGLFDTTLYEYTINEYGEFRITCNVDLTINSGNPGDLGLELYIDGVFFDGILNDPGNLQPFTFLVGHLGKKLTLRAVTQLANNITVNSVMLYVLKGTHPELNIYANEINYANHVPDISVRDFLVALRKFPGIRIDFNPAALQVILDFADDIFDAEKDDITSKAAKNYELDVNTGAGYTLGYKFSNDTLLTDNFIDLSDFTKLGEYNAYTDLPTAPGLNYYAVVKNTNKIYKAIFNDPDYEWELLCDNYYDKVIGDGSTEIRTAFSPMLMTLVNVGGAVIIPQIEQAGSSPSFASGINEFQLKLAIWHGLQPGFTGDYPLASSQNRDYNGDLIGNLTLRHDDNDYGVYQTFWKRWIPFLMSTETVVRRMKLTINDAFGALFSRLKTVQYVDHVVKKVSIEIGPETVEVSDTEMCKVL